MLSASAPPGISGNGAAVARSLDEQDLRSFFQSVPDFRPLASRLKTGVRGSDLLESVQFSEPLSGCFHVELFDDVQFMALRRLTVLIKGYLSAEAAETAQAALPPPSRQLLPPEHAGVSSAVRDAFCACDRSGSGFLCEREAREAVRALGIELSQPDASRAMQRHFPPKGIVDLTEFSRLFADVAAMVMRTRNAAHAADAARPAPAHAAQADAPTIAMPQLLRSATALPPPFAASLPPPSPEPIPAHVRAVFEAFDVRRAGRLSSSELRDSLCCLGLEVDADSVADIAKHYDDKAVALDLAEFARLVADLTDATAGA